MLDPNVVIHKGWLELLQPLSENEVLIKHDYVDTQYVKEVLYKGYLDGNSEKLINNATKIVSPLSFGPLSLLAWSSNNINELMNVFSSYSVLLGSPIRLVTSVTETGNIELIVRNTESQKMEISYLGQSYYVFILISLMVLICPELRNQIQLKMSHFPFSSDKKYQYEQLLGCEIYLRQGLMTISIHKSLLTYPIKTKNQELHDALLPVVSRQAQRMISLDIIQRSYDFLDEQETLMLIDNELLAQSLSMTSRTLNRRFNQIGTNYRDLLDKYRYERALRLLEKKMKSITEVAYELGYADISSFTRAFKRWSGGVSPSTLS